MINKETDIIVVGGGIVGLLSACMLAEVGRAVTIIDRSELVRESSWAGGGILTPLYPWRYPASVNQLAFRSQSIYADLTQSLLNNTKINSQYIASGMLINKADIDDVGYHWLDAHRVNYYDFEGPSFGENTQENSEFVFLPDIAQLRNPYFAQALKIRAQQLGVSVKPNWEIDRVECESSRFVLYGGSRVLAANNLVVCAGAWSGHFLKGLGVNLPVTPVRGQMLLYKTEPGFLSSIILSNGHYIIPRQDGRVLVGSTMEDVGFNKQTTTKAKKLLEEFVRETLPELQNYPIEKHWAGLRPGSPDGIPFILRHPDIDNLYINTGHFRNGVVMAPASAELLVDIMTGSKPKIDASPYANISFCSS